MYQQARITMVVGLLLLMVWAQAAQPKVAVLGFRNGHTLPAYAGAGESLRDAFEQRLVESRRFVMVEREQLASLLNEENLARADMINDPYGIARRLKGSEVDYLVTGSVGGDEDLTTAIAKFIRVSGEDSGTVPHSLRSVGYSIGKVGFLAHDLGQQAKACFPISGRVTGANGRFVEFNLGRKQGVWVGDEFSVLQERKVGDGVGQEDIARVRVVEVHPDFARGEMSWEDERVRPGMTLIAVSPRLASEPYAGRRALVLTPTKALGAGVEDWQAGSFGEELFGGVHLAAQPMGLLVLASEDGRKLCEAESERCESDDFDWTQYQKPSFLSPYYLVNSTLEQTEGDVVARGSIVERASRRVVASRSILAADPSAAADGLAQGLLEDLRKRLEADDFKIPQTGLVKVDFKVNYSTIPARRCNVILPRLYGEFVEYELTNLSSQPVRLRVTTDVPGYSLLPRSEQVCLAPHGDGQGPLSRMHTPLLNSSLLEGIDSEIKDAKIVCDVELLTEAGAVSLVPPERRATPLRILPASTWTTDFGQPPKVTKDDTDPLDEEQRALSSVAAWVQDSPALRALLAKTPQGKSGGIVLGYQNPLLTGPLPTDNYAEKRDFVRDQVKAVYDVLQAEGVHYVDASKVAFPPKESQRVLPPDEVLRNKAGNCMELSLLFASILRGTIETAVVITNGHAFVAWHTWSYDDAAWDVLETTLIGSADFDTACEQARTKYPQIAQALAGKVVFTEPLGTILTPTIAEVGALAVINVWTATEAYSSIDLASMGLVP